MSRSHYNDDFEMDWAGICYRGSVASAMRGKRGQQLLRDALAALDAMPVKELIAESLVTEAGQYCTLGVVGAMRGISMAGVNPENYTKVAEIFNIAEPMVREIVWANDECGEKFDPNINGSGRGGYRSETPAERWKRMREWIAKQIREPNP